MTSYAAFRELMHRDSLRYFVNLAPERVTVDLFLVLLEKIEDAVSQHFSLLTDHRRKLSLRPIDRREELGNLFRGVNKPPFFSLLNSTTSTWRDGYVITFRESQAMQSFDAQVHMEIWIPPSSILDMKKIIEAVGSTFNLPYTHWTPPSENGVLAYQLDVAQRSEQEADKKEPRIEIKLFPTLNVGEFARKIIQNDVFLPDQIGWVNYWSAQTCHSMSFPDIEQDQYILQHSRALPTGAWVVALTSEPLDFTHEEHLQIARWAYARFGNQRQ